MSIEEQLCIDFLSFGYPYILVQRHGFRLEVKPNEHQILKNDTGADFVFYQNGRPICVISLAQGFKLVELPRPDNMIVKCKKCYAVEDSEDGSRPCVIYWPV